MKDTYLYIDRVDLGSNTEREHIGTIPLTRGAFSIETELGLLEGEVCPVDASQQQKVIFVGDVFPSVNRRGKQRYHHSSRRRVVDIPHDPNKKALQSAGRMGTLEFRKVNKIFDESEMNK